MIFFWVGGIWVTGKKTSKQAGPFKKVMKKVMVLETEQKNHRIPRTQLFHSIFDVKNNATAF